MPDLWERPPGDTMKRKRLDTTFDVAIDLDDEVDHFKRQNIDDGNDAIDLTPTHQIPELLGSATVDPTPTTSAGMPQTSQISAPPLEHSPKTVPKSPLVQPYQTIREQQFQPNKISKRLTSPSKPQSSQQCTLTSEPQSAKLPTSPSTRPHAIPELEARSASNQPDNPTDQSNGVQKWTLNEWDEDSFDSDEESMSLAITMKLANELSLLKSFLDLYKKFNIHLGGKQSHYTNTQSPLTYLNSSQITDKKTTTRHRIRPPPQRIPPPHFLHRHPPRRTHHPPAHPPRRKTTRQPLPRQHGTRRREDLPQMQGPQ